MYINYIYIRKEKPLENMCRNCQIMLGCHPWSLVEDHPRKHIEEQVWSTVRTSEFGGIVALYNDGLGPHVL